jgi:HK97 gp10 family phage protein
MADGVSIKVRGLDRNLAKLKSVAPTLDQEMDKALAKSANEVVTAAQALAPRDTGAYAGSITAQAMGGSATFQNRKNVGGRRGLFRRGRSRLQVTSRTVSATMAYGIFADWIWQFLEFGTIKMAARPHLFPAYRLLEKRITGRLRRAMGKAIKDALR